MLQVFEPGDVLVFQLESGYAMLRVLAVDDNNGETVWHLSAYADLFLDVESAEAALGNVETLTHSTPHIALTNRAFESTQVARIAHSPLNDSDIAALSAWRDDPQSEVSDRSVRLMLGLR